MSRAPRSKSTNAQLFLGHFLQSGAIYGHPPTPHLICIGFQRAPWNGLLFQSGTMVHKRPSNRSAGGGASDPLSPGPVRECAHRRRSPRPFHVRRPRRNESWSSPSIFVAFGRVASPLRCHRPAQVCDVSVDEKKQQKIGSFSDGVANFHCWGGGRWVEDIVRLSRRRERSVRCTWGVGGHRFHWPPGPVSPLHGGICTGRVSGVSMSHGYEQGRPLSTHTHTHTRRDESRSLVGVKFSRSDPSSGEESR
jgi:hypothetical protein